MAYDHQVPATYMKPWCFSGESVYYFDNNNEEIVRRNINKIMGQTHFHSIRPGMAFQTPNSLKLFFSDLGIYNISVNGIALDTVSKLHQNYYLFDEWEIKKGDGNILSKKEKNELKHKLSHLYDDSIEKEWSRQFENDWRSFIQNIYDTLNSSAGESLLATNYEKLIKYIIMFQWRKSSDESAFQELLGLFDFLKAIDIPEDQRTNVKNKTAYDEMRHELLLKLYYDFLTNNNDGALLKIEKIFLEKLTCIFIIPKQQLMFVTGDSPYISFTNKDGFLEPIFIALPNLLVSLALKDSDNPTAYKVHHADNSEIQEYNRVIRENSLQLILPIQDIKLLFGE